MVASPYLGPAQIALPTQGINIFAIFVLQPLYLTTFVTSIIAVTEYPQSRQAPSRHAHQVRTANAKSARLFRSYSQFTMAKRKVKHAQDRVGGPRATSCSQGCSQSHVRPDCPGDAVRKAENADTYDTGPWRSSLFFLTSIAFRPGCHDLMVSAVYSEAAWTLGE
jgi:hypothetical protein